MCRAAPAYARRAGWSRPLPLRQGGGRDRPGLRHGLAPAHRPSRRRLGVDDRCWMLPCHYLYQGCDEVRGLLLVFLMCMWHYSPFFCLFPWEEDLGSPLASHGCRGCSGWVQTSILLHF